MRNLLIFALVVFLSPPLFAKMYVWTDEDGNKHYSDRVPPSQIQQKRKILDEKGIVVEEVDRAKTKEELAREKELKKRREEQLRLAKERENADRVLLRTFRSEDDIIMARNGKLASMDAKIQIIRGNIRRQKERMAEQQLSAANMERAGKTVPEHLLKEIDDLRAQIQDDYQSLIAQEQLKQKIRERAADDLLRFRQLKNLNSTGEYLPKAKESVYSLLETLVICSEDCDTLWEKAEDYVRKHATTRMQLIGKHIIMTKQPSKDTDVSLTVSRIKNKKGEEEFFLDVQCKDTTPGKEHCNSEPVQSIRHGFKELQQHVVKKKEKTAQGQAQKEP